MAFNPERIFEILHKHGVEHIVVGGIGGVLHGSPMSTDDVDIVPSLDLVNLYSLAEALNEMNARLAVSSDKEPLKVNFSGKDLKRWVVDFRFLNLETDFGRLDVIYRPEGTTGYRDLAQKAESLELGSIELRVAALEDIIRSKQAVARERDLAQLPTLRKLLERKRADLRPGARVTVPWNFNEMPGTIVEIRGTGPKAHAIVLVELPNGAEQELPFPVSLLTAAK